MIFIHEAFATDLAHKRQLLVMLFYMKLVIVCRTELLVAIVHFTCYFDRCLQINLHKYTGRERLIRSHSSARFCFELSGNSN